MFDINVNVEVGKMSKLTDIIILSGIYWPLLFAAYYFFPKWYPNTWAILPEDNIIIAFICACFLTIWPYAAWMIAWKRAKIQLHERAQTHANTVEQNANAIKEAAENKLSIARGLAQDLHGIYKKLAATNSNYKWPDEESWDNFFKFIQDK